MHDTRNFIQRALNRAMGDAGYINTDKGWLHRDDVSIDKMPTEMPCGSGETTEYYSAGECVRRDVSIKLRGMSITGSSGPTKE